MGCRWSRVQISPPRPTSAQLHPSTVAWLMAPVAGGACHIIAKDHIDDQEEDVVREALFRVLPELETLQRNPKVLAKPQGSSRDLRGALEQDGLKVKHDPCAASGMPDVEWLRPAEVVGEGDQRLEDFCRLVGFGDMVIEARYVRRHPVGELAPGGDSDEQEIVAARAAQLAGCLLYTSPSPRDS